MDTITTAVTVGKYKFQIIDNALSHMGQIYSRNFNIGGNQTDGVKVSILYNQNQPVAAVIPHIVPDNADYSMDPPTFIMMQTLLQHIHNQLPAITEVKFEDKSSIEYAPDVRPIPLYYFSIAFNGETWYEKYFNARLRDKRKHDKYTTTIKNLLYSEEVKTNTTFIQFLEIAQPPIEITNELEQYYNNTVTFGDFFHQMPEQDRCRLAHDWITRFMSHYLKDVMDNAEWIIELPIEMNGGRRHTRIYYCPRGRIAHKMTYKDFGIDLSNFS